MLVLDVEAAVEAPRPSRRLDGLIMPASLAEDFGQIRPGLRVGRLQPQRRAAAFDRAVRVRKV